MAMAQLVGEAVLEVVLEVVLLNVVDTPHILITPQAPANMSTKSIRIDEQFNYVLNYPKLKLIYHVI